MKNKYYFPVILMLILLIVGLGVYAILVKNTHSKGVTIEDTFTINAPDGWKVEPNQGSNAKFGVIRGDGMVISYGFAESAVGVDAASENVTSREIDGRSVYLLQNKEVGELVAYFPDIYDRPLKIDVSFFAQSAQALEYSDEVNGELSLVASGLSGRQFDLALRIIMSIDFCAPPGVFGSSPCKSYEI